MYQLTMVRQNMYIYIYINNYKSDQNMLNSQVMLCLEETQIYYTYICILHNSAASESQCVWESLSTKKEKLTRVSNRIKE